MDNKANPFNLVSDVVFLRYVFNLRKVEKLLSAVATETGRTANNFKRVYILGNKCFLHNLSNYDAHFIVTELGYDTKTISVIPKTEENIYHF